jgi:dTDP-4-dehydrorhamnose 3,5-epimerase
VNGFKAIGNQKAIVANCSTIAHDPEEIKRFDPFDKRINYNWEIRHG